MATFQIGRVGLDVDLNAPTTWGDTGRGITTVTLWLKASTLAQTQALRTELLDQIDKLVAVTNSVDATQDGYYILRDVTVDINAATIGGTGLFRTGLTLEKIGRAANTDFQTLTTYCLISNDYGLIASETEAFQALPAAHYGSTADANGGSITRPSEDGNITTYLDITQTQKSSNFGIAPADYYDGAAYIKVGGRLRTGTDTPLDASDWELGNGILKIAPAASGRITTAAWDGTSAYQTAVSYYFEAGTTTVTSWNAVHVLRNDAEACAIRLVNDQAPSGGAHRHYVDLTLRRGSLFVAGYWYYTETGTQRALEIHRNATEASTAITPTGATGAIGIRATSNDASGDRFCMAMAKTNTQDLTNGVLTHTPTGPPYDHSVPFMIGCEINGSSAQAGDTAAELMLQWVGSMTEQVRAVHR